MVNKIWKQLAIIPRGRKRFTPYLERQPQLQHLCNKINLKNNANLWWPSLELVRLWVLWKERAKRPRCIEFIAGSPVSIWNTQTYQSTDLSVVIYIKHQTTESKQWQASMGCEAQLVWKCLITHPPFSASDHLQVVIIKLFLYFYASDLFTDITGDYLD